MSGVERGSEHTSVQEFLAQLYRLDVKLHRDGDRLRLRAPKGALSAALRTELAARKEEILAFLSQVELATQGTEIKIRPAPRTGKLPLSFAQQRLWFLQELEGPGATYNLSHCVRLSGDLDPDALEQALQEIVHRHEILRTSFPEIEGEPIQQIASELHVPLQRISLPKTPGSGLNGSSPSPDRTSSQLPAFMQLAKEIVQRPFDLACGPLLRAALIEVAARESVLVFVMHHIVSDGWSIELVVQEFVALYQAFVAGAPSPLAPLPIQYADFAQWQRQWLTGAPLQRQIDFWRQHLAGAPDLLELPTDRARPAHQSYRGATEEFVIDAQLAARLHDFCRQSGASPFMALQALFAILLMRYSGQEDLVIGAPVANRTYQELEALIGFFVNTLALRSDLSGNPSFSEMVERTRQSVLGAQTHQDIPFERLVEELHPARNLSHHPIFQVMFVLQNIPEREIELPALRLTPFEIDTQAAKFDLTLSLYETVAQSDARAAHFEGVFEYSTDLFERSTIQRMIGHFTVLLDDALRNPACKIWDLALLTDSEQHQILHTWNETARDYDLERCLHRWFEAQAAEAPDRVALEFEDQTLTYGDLNQRANQLAHRLRRLGVGPAPAARPLVGVCMERSIEMVVSLYAILKAGGAYVPMDPEYPAERLHFMLDDAQPPVLLTQARFAHLAPAGAQTLAVDESWADIAQEATENPQIDLNATDLAYVIFTSGSTGRPKGAMNSHRGIVNRLLWMQEAYGLDESDAVLQKTPFSFDVSVWEFFWPLMTGARLVIAAPGGHKDNAYLVNLIQARKVTTLHFVPPMLQHFVEETGMAACTSLRRVICSGEALPFDLTQRFFARAPQGVELHNLYGPTEAAIDVTYWACRANDPLGKTPIGRPVANTQIYVLDRYLQPAPVGVYGELHIGGVQVGQGYLNRPQLTAEKFIPDPFSSDPQSRLYKTGDLVRFLEDGNIEYIGRIDHQVKLRGFRIELGEIEAVLAESEAVRECVVVVHDAAPGGQQLLAAYVVPADAPTEELRERLRERLPDYMVPAAIVALESLPLSPNGKIDRRALPAPYVAAREEHFVEPQSAVERTLAVIWAEVLGLDIEKDPVGLHDNFFALGGHSLLAMQVRARIRTLLQTEAPVRMLFEATTIAQLAPAIERLRQGADVGQVLSVDAPLIPILRRDHYPLSFAQQRLWFLTQLEGDSAAYNMPGALAIDGALDVDCLQAAIDEIVRRHESLRTLFATVDGEPVQIIEQRLTVPIERVDLRGQAGADQTALLEERLNQEAQRPFDLTQGPLLRVILFRVDALPASAAADRSTIDERADAPQSQAHVLLLNMHHIVSDGWSLGVLVHELSRLYSAYAQGQPSPLPKLALQYVDYSAWQRTWLRGEALDRQLRYWRERLAGAPAQLELPTDRPRPPRRTFTGRQEGFRVDADLTAALNALAQHAGVSLFMLLQAAFAILLYRYSGQEDIVIGTPVANRDREEIEGLIGFFVNTLALRTELAGNPVVTDLLQQVRLSTLEGYAHQDLPFEQLVEALQPARNLSHSPLFQVMLAWQTMPHLQSNPQGLTISPLALEATAAKYDLTLFMQETEADPRSSARRALIGSVEYNSDLFNRTSMQRLIRHLQTLLAAIVANPHARIDALDLLPHSERRQLLRDWNDTTYAFPGADHSIHALIEEQVERTPDAVAVRFEAQSMTYAELNGRANQLARYLRTLGAGSAVDRVPLVGICMERSLDLLVAIVAVLKAGVAYLPLDPAYPLQRLRYMLEESRPSVLLTETSQSGIFSDKLLGEEAASPRLLYLDQSWERIARESAANPAIAVQPHDLAYVIYTSGSTGNPKGVLISHHAIGNRMRWGQALMGLTSADNVLQKTPYSFDASVWELLLPLQVGARVVMARPDGHRDSAYLTSVIRDEAITVLQGVPSMYRMLVEDPGFQHCKSLRWIFSAGEALPMALARQVIDTLRRGGNQHVRFVNTYGPTEASIDVASWTVDPEVTYQTAPIGRPIANTRIFILDRQLQPVPIGVPGELHVEGAGLAQGYLYQPELTQSKFIPNPFSDDPDSRLYKTGDRVRYLEDGAIEFLGRLDFQVKVRGFRIELGEVEAALGAHPSLQECVVVALEDENAPEQKRLVAYVVRAQNGDPEGDAALEFVADLRRSLHALLPDYMVPAAFVQVHALPLTPNGKVDRARLPAPERADLGLRYIAPRDAIEIQLAGIWSELLDLHPVGVRDDFFALGGHSLLAVRLVARIEAAFGRALPLAALFEHASVEALANLLRERPAEELWSPLTAIQPQGDAEPFFCVPGAGGTVIYLVHLARYLGRNQPFYGLQSVGLDGASAPYTSIEAIAAAYVTAIQAAKAQGPYLLGGHSFGGKVAFEMAQQLRRAGHEVTLYIFDTPAPGHESDAEPERDEADWLALVAADIAHFLGREIDVTAEALRPLGAAEQLIYLRDRLVAADWLPAESNIQQLRGLVEVYKANLQTDYVPSDVIPVPIVLLRTRDPAVIDNVEAEGSPSPAGDDDPDWGWGQFADGAVVVHYVPGDHYTMMAEPHVETLAATLKQSLQRRS